MAILGCTRTSQGVPDSCVCSVGRFQCEEASFDKPVIFC